MNETRRAVLDAIADRPVSGPALAERLDISRAAIWKHVDALRDDGFTIRSGDEGYRLVDVPEYGGTAVEYGLDAPFAVEYHDSIGSTNDRARELATEGRSDVVVLANEQTGGRGRLDRPWSSPPGGIWMSVVVRPDLPPARAPLLTLAAAVAVTRAARSVGVDAEIKWPNDVLVPATDTERGGLKLAGILTEMEGEANRVNWLVVGMGINANVDPTHLDDAATSIQAEEGAVDRRPFVQDVLETFDNLRIDPARIVPAWREYASTLGQRVRVETHGGVVEGDAVDVTEYGALVVKTDDGEAVVHAGDCEHLRPAT